MNRGARVVRRGTQLAVGLVLYAVSMAMLLHAGLGNMPWDVLGQGLARHLGWTFGHATLVVSVAVLVCWIPLRQRPGIGTVANVLVIGLLVDPILAGLDHLLGPGGADEALVVRIALSLAGIVVNALATGLYVGARLGPGPRDGLMTGLVARTGRSVRLVRTSIEVTVVAIGWALGGTFGPTTILYAVAIGPLVHVAMARLTVPGAAAPARAGTAAGTVRVAASSSRSVRGR